VGEGAMAAVLGMEREEIEQLCEDASEGDILSPANFNCPVRLSLVAMRRRFKEPSIR